jgi:glutamate-1-semialdehyde aminotransferase
MQDTFVSLFYFYDLSSVSTLIEANPNELAAIIVEPVAGNIRFVFPSKGFRRFENSL